MLKGVGIRCRCEIKRVILKEFFLCVFFSDVTLNKYFFVCEDVEKQ